MAQRVDLKLKDVQYFSVWFYAVSFCFLFSYIPTLKKFFSCQIILHPVLLLPPNQHFYLFKYIFCVLCGFFYLEFILLLLKSIYLCLTYLHSQFNRDFPQLPVSALGCRMTVLLNNKSK